MSGASSEGAKGANFNPFLLVLSLKGRPLVVSCETRWPWGARLGYDGPSEA